MLKWYRINTTSSDAARNVVKSLKKQRLMVRRHSGGLVACSSDHHQVWLSRVCQDFHATLMPLEKAPIGVRTPKQEEYVAPCGENFYDPIMVGQHTRWCPKCREQPVKMATQVVAKLEPGVEFNLDGVISSLEVVRDQWWEQVENLDGLLTNLKAYRDNTAKLSELEKDTEMRVNAIKLILDIKGSEKW